MLGVQCSPSGVCRDGDTWGGVSKPLHCTGQRMQTHTCGMSRGTSSCKNTSFSGSSGTLQSCLSDQLMPREILNTVFLEFQASEITEHRTDTALCYVLLRTSLFPNSHSLWQNFGKCFSVKVETCQGEKEGSWPYQFVVNIFYTLIKKILNHLNKPLAESKKIYLIVLNARHPKRTVWTKL